MSRRFPTVALFAFAICAGATIRGSAIAQEAPAPPPPSVESDTAEAVDRVFNENQPWVDSMGAGCNTCSPCDEMGSCCWDSSCDDIWTRKSLTNGLWGAGQAMAEQGILYKASVTQFYQGVTSGGREQTDRYGGKVDQFMIFDGGKLGLWDGLRVIMHTETSFGENSIFDATGLVSVNTAALTPRANEHVTAITNLMVEQQLGGGWAATVGRINTIDLWTMLYPKFGAGLDGFMNTATMLPLNTIPTLPTIFNGGGLLKVGDRGVEAALLVLDPVNIPTTSNLSNLFDNGSTIVGLGRVYTDFGRLPGSHTVLGTYATGDYTSFDRNGWSFQPGQGGLMAAQRTGSWMASYIMQQALWADPCDERRSIDLMTTLGWSDRETSPYEFTGNVTLEAYGLISDRENDRMGAGYFYLGLSDNLKSLLPALLLDDMQGAEVYYNAEITPWFHLTADLQVIEPALGRRDTAVVLGLRGKIDL